MTETRRIRWVEEDGSRDFAALTGYVGTIGVPQFKIYAPGLRGGLHQNEWLLMSRLPGQDTIRYADSQAELKAEAEAWLEEFAASLGAVFPDPATTTGTAATATAGFPLDVPAEGIGYEASAFARRAKEERW